MEGRKNKKCKVRLFMLIIFLTVSTTFLPLRSFGGDMEILLDKLVGKGILTKPEAESILQEMKETKGMEPAEAQKPTAEAQQAKPEEKKTEPEWVQNLPDWIKNPPDWIKNIKFSGDLRLRYEYSQRDTTPSDDEERNRGRFRLRVGADTTILKDVSVGFGLASGNGDPRSTNQTFDSTFSKKPINIDYAQAIYTPLPWLLSKDTPWLSLQGGKLKNNPIFRANSVGSWPSELAWDNDITPEGAAAVFNYANLLNFEPISLDLFMNDGFFILAENYPSGSNKEPYFFVVQPGFNLKILKDINFKVAGAKYLFNGIQDHQQLQFSSNSNTYNTVGGVNFYKFNYNAWIGSAELGFSNPFHQNYVPYVGFFGEYIYNPNANDNRDAYIAGIRVGAPSLKKFADWQLEYAYRRLEKDAWLDVFPDSTFYSGATNAKGHKGSIYFGLAKNLFIDFNYFHAVNIIEFTTRNYKRPEDVFQADIQFNF